MDNSSDMNSQILSWLITISGQLDQMHRIMQDISDVAYGKPLMVNPFANPIEHLYGDTFGDRLRDALKQRHMSAVELGTRIGVNNSTISRYINNRAYPKKWRIKNIADALMISPDMLISGTEKVESQNSDA